jgi:16S rRNA (guanine527-N7)-methyltransferase
MPRRRSRTVGNAFCYYYVHSMTSQALDDDFIRETLRGYGVSATPRLCGSIRTYIELLLRWNRKIALTTVTRPAEILRFHFGESMFAVREASIRHGRLADVGTGAGFPALPISMVVPELNCVLIESNQKKAAFLSEVVRILNLDKVEVYRGRMESLASPAQKLDFSISRALGMHVEFLSWSSAHLNMPGKVILWVGDKDAAQISLNKGWIWSSPSRIPESEHRVLLMGSKIA